MSESAAQRALLIVLNGASEGTTHPLATEETLLGRSPSADVTLTDEGISREHALVSCDTETGGWSIEDLQSTNGTKVNGKRVRSATLTHGDEIQLGRTRLDFRLLSAD